MSLHFKMMCGFDLRTGWWAINDNDMYRDRHVIDINKNVFDKTFDILYSSSEET